MLAEVGTDHLEVKRQYLAYLQQYRWAPVAAGCSCFLVWQQQKPDHLQQLAWARLATALYPAISRLCARCWPPSHDASRNHLRGGIPGRHSGDAREASWRGAGSVTQVSENLPPSGKACLPSMLADESLLTDELQGMPGGDGCEQAGGAMDPAGPAVDEHPALGTGGASWLQDVSPGMREMHGAAMHGHLPPLSSGGLPNPASRSRGPVLLFIQDCTVRPFHTAAAGGSRH